VDAVTDVQGRNVDANHIGQVARQTFDGQRTQTLLEQAAHVLDAVGDANRFQRNVGLDHFVLRYSVEIDMENGAAERSVLDFLDECEAALPRDLQLHQNILARGVAEQRVDVPPGYLQRLRFVLRAIHDGGHRAGRF
jgi:hypothetical protein